MYKVKTEKEIKEYNNLLEAKMNALHYFKKNNKLVEVLDEDDEVVFSKTNEDFQGKISYVEELQGFKAARKELGLSDEDIEDIKNQLKENPNAGDRIKGTGGARKIRIALKNNNKGKSGDARIVYLNVYVKETIYLIMIFAKSTQADLTSTEKKFVKNIVDFLKNK